MQAVGKDAAGRSQYLYHANHVRRQDAKKFQRLIKFAEALPKMRATVAAQLRQPGLGKRDRDGFDTEDSFDLLHASRQPGLRQ